MGEPLSDEQYGNIRDWIPPLPGTMEEDERSEPSESSSNPVTIDPAAHGTESSGEDSDDSDIERHLTKRYRELAFSSLEQRDYNRSEQFYRSVIERNEEEGSSPDETRRMKIMLSYVCGIQEKWDEVEEILVPIAMAKGTPETMAFHGLQALAMVRLEKGEHDLAIKYCKRAVGGHRKFGGKSSAPYHRSMALLAQIYDSNSDTTAAEVARSFLPTNYDFSTELRPCEYLEAVIADTISNLRGSPSLSNIASIDARALTPTPGHREPTTELPDLKGPREIMREHATGEQRRKEEQEAKEDLETGRAEEETWTLAEERRRVAERRVTDAGVAVQQREGHPDSRKRLVTKVQTTMSDPDIIIGGTSTSALEPVAISKRPRYPLVDDGAPDDAPILSSPGQLRQGINWKSTSPPILDSNISDEQTMVYELEGSFKTPGNLYMIPLSSLDQSLETVSFDHIFNSPAKSKSPESKATQPWLRSCTKNGQFYVGVYLEGEGSAVAIEYGANGYNSHKPQLLTEFDGNKTVRLRVGPYSYSH
jgi:hypothetical protein